MSSEIAGLIGLVVLVILVFSRMWIALAMLFVGVWGIAYIGSFNEALGVLSTIPYRAIASYSISALPLFILMGVVISNTGVGADLYNTAYKWVGQLRGGLSMATVTACAGFAAISGSSTATAATMGKVALPEMRKYKYDPKLAAGCIASGGTMGILIPPSIGFIIYGILTAVSIGKLFIAGIIPGVLQAIFYIVTIYIMCKFNPQLGPAGLPTGIKEKIVSLKYTWPMIVLFALVIGGIYMGIFTPTEAGAVGAFGAIVITFIMRRLKGRNLLDSVMQTGQSTVMIILLIVGSFVFSYFVAISKLSFVLGEFVTGLAVSKYVVLAIIIFLYIICGMFLEITSAIILTVPIFFPVVLAMNFDPVWYGVIMVRMMEIGMITPPIGMNVFVLAGVTDIPLATIFRGVVPFVIADIFHVALLVAFPSISLLLPSLM